MVDFDGVRFPERLRFSIVAVLIFHSFLLRGTGSNVYTAELTKELARQGRDVHLFCQDREAGKLDWVDAVGHWDRDGLVITSTGARAERDGGGMVTAYVPDIGGLLPVFVRDEYAGFRVKTFPEMSDREISEYIEANVAAVRDVSDRAGPFEACLANHLVLAPSILARAGLRFALKVHGSDLSYAVGPFPDRFGPFAVEAVDAAEAILVGSTHTAEQLWEAVSAPDLERRTRLGPPGMDPASFRPGRRSESLAALARVGGPDVDGEGEGAFGRRSEQAASGLRWFAEAEGPRVLYVGKLLINKGVDLLLAAWPLIHFQRPGARLLLGGFGRFSHGLEQLWSDLSGGDIVAARRLAGEAIEAGPGAAPARELRLLKEFLEAPPTRYEEACRAAAGSVRITGRLEHGEVARAMSAADLLYMPSTFPEAFGMVIAEAAASGTFPISAAHSGMLEVSNRLAEAVGSRWQRDLSFDLAQDPIPMMASKGLDWLGAGEDERSRIEGHLARLAAERWGWERVSADFIAAANGELERLQAPRRTF